MLTTAIILTTLGLLLLPLALRGRLTARGLFCRKCKFDLAGLDPARPNPTCPECGRDVSRPKATRPTLRSVSRIGIVSGIILILLGGALGGFSSPQAQSIIWPRLPSGILVRLAERNVSGAIDELVTRVSTPSFTAGDHWPRMIDTGLKHQADTSATWDQRWGTLLERLRISRSAGSAHVRLRSHGSSCSFWQWPASGLPGATDGRRILPGPA